MAKPFAKSEDPDQMLHSTASDLGLHCSHVTLLGVSRLQMLHSTASDLGLHCSHVTLLGVSRLKWVEENRPFLTCSHLKTLKVDNIALDKWWYQVNIFLLLYKNIWSYEGHYLTETGQLFIHRDTTVVGCSSCFFPFYLKKKQHMLWVLIRSASAKADNAQLSRARADNPWLTSNKTELVKF